MTSVGDPSSGRDVDSAPDDDAALLREFGALLDRREVRALFQPVVDLNSGEIVALEALARGPASSRLASPLVLFDVARKAGRVGELDWVCRTAAFKAFLDGGVPPSMTLFVNVEPEALAEECPHDLAHLVAKAESLLRVFVDVNDRALADDPAGVLAAVDRAREMGWGVAIDDIGAGRAPLAMLPIVDADVVKLDRRALKEASTERAAAVITSVLRHVETTGAALLVEGIESEEDARWARALGAVYGQGYHLGAPGPLEHYHPPRTPVRQIRMAETVLRIDSPFELFEDQELPRMDEELMDELISLIANAPRSAGAWPVLIASAGRRGELSEAMSKHLGATHAHLLCVIFGSRMPGEPAPGVHGVRIRAEDPLNNERLLIVLSDQAPVALFARGMPDGLYDVAVTQDAALVHAIAHHLIRRVPRAGADNLALSARPFEPQPVIKTGDGVVEQKHRSWRGRLARH